MTEEVRADVDSRIRSLKESRFKAKTILSAVGVAAGLVAGVLGVTQYSIYDGQKHLRGAQGELERHLLDTENLVSASVERATAAESVSKSVLAKVAEAETIATTARDTAVRLAEEAQKAAAILDRVEATLGRASRAEEAIDKSTEGVRPHPSALQVAVLGQRP